ncbi:MAG: phosphotransferase [Ilumatobacteraceae bacterium]
MSVVQRARSARRSILTRSQRSFGGTVVRVAGHLARDRITRPRAVRCGDVPTSVAAITPAWLTDVLCGGVPGAAVLGASVLGSSRGTHERHRLELTYNDVGSGARLPRSVFVKSLPTLVTRMIGGYNGTARVEGQFYARVRPQLDLEAPIGYHSAFDPSSLACVNLLEDVVATKSAVFCDHRTRVTREMAEGMIDVLAVLHGHFYDDRRLDTDLRWLADYPTWFRVGARKMRTEHYTARAIERAAGVIPAAVLDRRDRIWPAVLEAVRIHERGPRSFLHSDVHIGNWYRTGTGSMGLCDWQCPSKGHWSRDVAYAMATALAPEDRRAWEHGLLERYVEQLAQYIGTSPALPEAWDLYRQQMVHALWMWTITLCHSPLLPAMQSEDTSLEMIARITTAMADLESIDAGRSVA